MIWLYRAPYSTNVERVALAMAHKGLDVEPIDISYEDRTPVEEVSGQGLVPVIDDEDRGEVVVDSTRILVYLDEHYPEPPLFPAEPDRRAEMEVFIDWFDNVWKGAPNAIELEIESGEADHDVIRSEGERMQSHVGLFERMLANRDFLLGDTVSAADFIAFPFLKYGTRPPAEDDDELFHKILDRHQQLGDEHPRLTAWIERIDAMPRA